MGARDPRLESDVDEEIVGAIRLRLREHGENLPRVALFLFECSDADALGETLDRIPKPVGEWLEEVVVMHDLPPESESLPSFEERIRARYPRLRIHRNPRSYDWGAARKAAFEYALRLGFDYVIVMRGDGVHPPEALPNLLYPALLEHQDLVLASRFLGLRGRRRSGMTLWGSLAQRAVTTFQNRVLGLRIQDYGSGFRLFSRRALAGIPFQLNSNDRPFDAEIVIQCRALGVGVREAPVGAAWSEAVGREELSHALRALYRAVEYRMHQLHVLRRGRYFVDHGVYYTLKESETSSHTQIVDAIQPGSLVLDLGCSQGLLARPLREKGVRVVGVDAGPHARLAAELQTYYQRDLELPLEIPEERSFDFLVVADVIEHLRNRRQLLRSARRYLKPNGRLIISTPNVALWFYRLSLLVGRFEYGPRGVLDSTHVHLYTRETFRREVERAGFHVVRERVTALPFEVVFESTGRSRLIRGVARFYHGLARLWPEMFAYQHILEAEITTLDEEATAPHLGG